MSEKSELELAWAAGLFDGEGSTGKWAPKKSAKRDPGRRYAYIRIQITQAENPAVLYRFLAAVGEGKVHGPYSPQPKSKKDYWVYVATGSTAEFVLELLWPYLSPPKRGQVERARAAIAVCRAAQVPLKPGPITADEIAVF